MELLAMPAAQGIATVGIWRVRDRGRSTILKLIRDNGAAETQWGPHSDPSHPFFWRREVDFYKSDIPAQFEQVASDGGGLRAPRCHGTSDHADGSVAFLLEDVGGSSAVAWPFSRYRRAAFDLGYLQGRLVGSPVLSQAWLSRDWLRVYLDRRVDMCAVVEDDDLWADAGVRSVLQTAPAIGPAEVRGLWNARHDLMGVLAEYPTTLCHLDFHPQNLFDVAGQTVVIDWAYAGVGRVGEDPGTLFVDAIADFHVGPEHMAEFFNVVVDGYAGGLRQAGLSYSTDDVRRAVAAGATAKYGWLMPAMLSSIRAGRTTLNGRPMAEAAPVWTALGAFLLELADIARTGAGGLPSPRQVPGSPCGT